MIAVTGATGPLDRLDIDGLLRTTPAGDIVAFPSADTYELACNPDHYLL